MTYREFIQISDAYWLGFANARKVAEKKGVAIDKDDINHRNFLTLIENIMFDEEERAEKAIQAMKEAKAVYLNEQSL